MAGCWSRGRWVFAIVLIVLSLLDLIECHGPGESLHEESAQGSVHLRSSSLVLVKVYCLIIVFVSTFASGISPYYFRWSTPFLVLGIQFAGGVFLATAFLHFLSDANSGFAEHTRNPYPFAFMLACVGYLLTMLGDVIIISVSSRQQSSGHEDLERGNSHKGSIQAKKVEDVASPTDGSNNGDGGDCNPECNEETGTTHAKHLVNAALIPKASLGDALLLILALCFHSVFEGIAIGISGTAYDAWRNLWTVSLHKIFAAIAMGIALLRIIPDRPLISCASYSFAFAISTPVGIAIGIIIDATTQGAIADWIYAISMGLAAGVFIFVAINHLLSKGFIPSSKCAVDTPTNKFLAVTFGVAVMAVVMIWD